MCTGMIEYVNNLCVTRNMLAIVWYMILRWLWLWFVLEKGYDIHMKDLTLFTKCGKKIYLTTKVHISRNKTFLLNIQNNMEKCLKPCYNDVSWLYHLRFGHLNFVGLSLMSKHEMSTTINHLDQLCEGHLLKKNKSRRFFKAV